MLSEINAYVQAGELVISGGAPQQAVLLPRETVSDFPPSYPLDLFFPCPVVFQRVAREVRRLPSMLAILHRQE